MPKTEGRKKAEIRSATPPALGPWTWRFREPSSLLEYQASALWSILNPARCWGRYLRPSDFGLLSAFGLRVSEFTRYALTRYIRRAVARRSLCLAVVQEPELLDCGAALFGGLVQDDLPAARRARLRVLRSVVQVKKLRRPPAG